MSKKFFSKNFKRAALSLAGVLFAGSLAGSALTLAGRTATADNSLELLYSSSVFNVETGATYKDDTGKSGVKLTTKASGTAAEGASFDFADSFTGDFELDFRVTSQNAYEGMHATDGWTHYLTSGKGQYTFSDYMNPYLDLKEVAFTFTSNSNPDAYFTVYMRGGHGATAWSPLAYVHVSGDNVYLADETGVKHYGYGLNAGGTYKTEGWGWYGDYNNLALIYGTTFSNYHGTAAGNKTPMTTVSNLIKFDSETMKVYVNNSGGYSTKTTADSLLRDLSGNTGFSVENYDASRTGVGVNSATSAASLNAEDFADGYSVSVKYTDVTANDTVGDSQYFGGATHYAKIIETPYDRYAAMTIYSVNGNSVSARNTVSNKTQESLVSFDTNDVTVTADSLNAVDNRRGLNFKSVASGTAAEGAGFAFNNVMYGNFETDFRVSSEKTYTPKSQKGYTHYVNNSSLNQTMSDGINPYLDLKEVAFKFASATNPDKYFKVYFRGAQSTTAFSTTAYVYIPGDTGAFRLNENNEKIYGYGLSNQGRYPYDGTTETFAGVATYKDIYNSTNIWGTSFSNYTATSSKDATAGALTSNLLKFDVSTMSVYVNSGTSYNTTNTSANVLLRDLATNAGANPELALGSLSKDDFVGGYTVSVEFTDVTPNNYTGWTESEFKMSDYSQYVVNPTAYDRYANMTIYSVNGQALAYETAGDSQSGITDTSAPVIHAPTTALEPETQVDVTPNFYDVLDGNVIGVYGKVSYSTDGVSFTEIERNSDNKYLFTPSEFTTYTFKYEGFKDIAGRKAETLTVERKCELNFAMAVGASIRTAADNTSGIRFEGTLSKISYDWLVKTYGAENLTFYYEISANGITKTQQVEESKIVYDEETQTYIMRAAIVGLVEEQYDMVFSAKLYVVAGEDTYNATENDNERTVRQVAQLIMADTEYYQSLDSWRRDIIASFAAGSAQ